MVQNKLSEADVRARAEELSFPSSVIEYFQGYLGKDSRSSRLCHPTYLTYPTNPSLPPSLLPSFLRMPKNSMWYSPFPLPSTPFFPPSLGIPPFGFPEPLRTHVLKGRTLPNGKACFDGRPGAELPAFAFEDEKQGLLDLFGKHIRDVDVMTYAQYPQVRKEGRERKGRKG